MNAKTLLLSLLILPALALTGCERDLGTNPVINAESAAPELKADATQFVLGKDTPQTVVFSWSAADYGQAIPAVYTLTLTNPSDPSHSISLPVAPGQKEASVMFDQDFNKRLVNELKLEMGKPGKLNAVVTATPLVEAGSPDLVAKAVSSAPVELTVTPFAFLMRPPYVYLVGAINGKNEWNINGTDYIFFADENDTNVLHYYGWFKENASFKIIPEGAVGDWAKVIGMSGGKLTAEGGDTDIKIIKEAGIYHLTLTLVNGSLDPEGSTLTAEKMNDVPTHTAMGLVGDAVISWDVDAELSNASADHIWVGRGIDIKPGKFKIRADKAWTLSWGASADNTFPADFGLSASSNAKDWVVTAETAGKYDVYFNDITGNYVFVKL